MILICYKNQFNTTKQIVNGFDVRNDIKIVEGKCYWRINLATSGEENLECFFNHPEMCSQSSIFFNFSASFKVTKFKTKRLIVSHVSWIFMDLTSSRDKLKVATYTTRVESLMISKHRLSQCLGRG